MNKHGLLTKCEVKMAGYWPHSFFASLQTQTSSRSINTQKKNLANIQPSSPHTCSITHTYSLLSLFNIKATFVEKIIVIANNLLVLGGSLIALHRQKISYQLYHSCTKLSGESLNCGSFLFVPWLFQHGFLEMQSSLFPVIHAH